MNATQAMKFTKILGYLTMTANGIFKLSSSIARKASDAVTDTRRYEVEIMEEGVVIRKHENCNTKKVQKLMRATSDLGLTQIIVTEMQ